jgi:hypothetical protein
VHLRGEQNCSLSIVTGAMGARRNQAAPVQRAHGRRDTNTYPQPPNSTGIIINIPHTAPVMVSQFLYVVAPVSRSWLAGGGRGDPEFNDDVGRRTQLSPSPHG